MNGYYRSRIVYSKNAVQKIAQRTGVHPRTVSIVLQAAVGGNCLFAKAQRSPDGRAYRDKVIEAVLRQIGKPEDLGLRYSVTLELHAPTRRKYDIDNRPKPILDALQAVGVWQDDEQIDQLGLYRGSVEKGGKVLAHIEELPAEA